MATAPLERDLQNQLANYQKLQNEYKKSVATREKLETQKQENDAVAQELKLMEEGAVVYKLIGPALVKQEKTEATENVAKRLEFIGKEVERYENLITDTEERMTAGKRKIMKLQTQLQAMRQKEQQAAEK